MQNYLQQVLEGLDAAPPRCAEALVESDSTYCMLYSSPIMIKHTIKQPLVVCQTATTWLFMLRDHVVVADVCKVS